MVPRRGDPAHARPQVAIADGLEAGQQPRGGAAGGLVERRLVRALPQCGPILVAFDERLQDLGQPKPRSARRIHHTGDRSRRPELWVGGVEVRDTTLLSLRSCADFAADADGHL